MNFLLFCNNFCFAYDSLSRLVYYLSADFVLFVEYKLRFLPIVISRNVVYIQEIV